MLDKEQLRKWKERQKPRNRCIWYVPKSFNTLEPLSEEELKMFDDPDYINKLYYNRKGK